ncbi:MAG: acyltransferase [Oscillospiraceae bacterium]|nr:acyltransferase [Oscillospiraceae bacterium]
MEAPLTERKYFIDNLRILSILMLFPFHASMCFLSGGYYGFYVYGGELPALRYIDLAVYPWWMSLMFALAGASAFYALKKRTAAEYVKERVLRLLAPFVCGLLLWIPIQSFIADVFYNGYQGGFLRHYLVFFTKWTDLTGYDGGFTPGHLWFILFLFVFSLMFLPLNAWYAKRDKRPELSKLPVAMMLIGGFVLLSAGGLVANVGGKGVLEYAVCFLLGFFLFTDDNFIGKLRRNWILLGGLWLAMMIFRCVMWNVGVESEVFWYLDFRALEWTGVLGAAAVGAKFLDFKNGFTEYFSPACFPIYWLHQTVLAAAAFFIVKIDCTGFLQFILITAVSFAVTLGLYEVCKRAAPFRFITGIKNRKCRR